MGQVIVHVQIVVMERHILFRVKHFQQCGRRVALEVAAELVDFIEHHYRIGSARPGNAVQNPARQCADICLPVSTDFSLVVHAAEGDTHVFPADSLGNGLAETRLADSRRTVETEDR